MKKILIITNFIEFPWEKGNHRYCYLADLLKDKYHVEILTSDFIHTKKTHREIVKESGYKVFLLHEPGYRTNVSIGRVISHKVFEKKVVDFLRTSERPDLIYIGLPPIGLAKAIIKYAKKNNIKTIIDIQDMWPESFEFLFPFVKWRMFDFLRNDADYVYKNANQVIAVSETYVQRALRVRNDNIKGLSVYLGTDKCNFDLFAQNTKPLDDGKIHIAYVGTLGASYDLKLLIDTVSSLPIKIQNKIVCEFLGSGPEKKELERYSTEKNVTAVFYGRIPYEDMVKKLVQCDIAINFIKYGTMQSIINKVGDYAMAGLPVINTQNNNEYRRLIDEYRCGINCKNGSGEEVSNVIEKLISDIELRKELGRNNRKLGEDLFDRAKTYPAIVDLINDEIGEK